MDKIREKRQKEDENYTYDDLPDIIALTVLCAYPSDVKEVIPWLRKAFDIKNSDADARRFNPRGHRAYHYIVSARSDVLLAHPELIGVKCEIQIKTLLDEALDAKTHDLTYKPGRRRVPKEMKEQFAILSSSLRAIDGQSEFLKDLIMFEERERALRREAAALQYFSQPMVIKVGRRYRTGAATPRWRPSSSG